MPLVVDPRYITVDHNRASELLTDLYVTPRALGYKWSRVTNQSAQVRIAYLGQHLASVVTGVRGEGSAARGNDLVDGSEVKACNRADQLGRCRSCDGPVGSGLLQCPTCGSDEINRKEDSHWIFSIKSPAELKQLLEAPRVVLVLFDRIDPKTLQARVWEIWPSEARHKHYRAFLVDYFDNNYMKKIAAALSPSPCNLHPLTYDFYMMQPLPVFRAVIHERDEAAEVEVTLAVEPKADRAGLASESVPLRTMKLDEIAAILLAVADEELLRGVSPELREEAGTLLGKFRDGAARGTASLVNSVGKRLMEMGIHLEGERMSTLAARTRRIKATPSSYRRRRPG